MPPSVELLLQHMPKKMKKTEDETGVEYDGLERVPEFGICRFQMWRQKSGVTLGRILYDNGHHVLRLKNEDAARLFDAAAAV